MCDGKQLWALEVNPRYTAAVEIVERAQGISAIDWHLRNSGEFPATAPNGINGKAILFAKHELEIDEKFSNWALDQGHLADIPSPGTRFESGDPLLTVFATEQTDAAVIATLRQRVEEVELKSAPRRVAAG